MRVKYPFADVIETIPVYTLENFEGDLVTHEVKLGMRYSF